MLFFYRSSLFLDNILTSKRDKTIQLEALEWRQLNAIIKYMESKR